MSDGGENTVPHQLILNLNCLGFDLKTVVLDKVPSRGLPRRYNEFVLAEDMFSVSNSAAVEIVLYFTLDNMPWEAVAEVLPLTTGVAPDQMDQVRKRHVDNARHYMRELEMSFPCTEVDQLTSFKKNATYLLELLKHLLPPDLGHARRVLTEAGPRMAFVVYKLTCYILQFQATGRIEPEEITGGLDTISRRNVLKSLVVRETMKFQYIAEKYLEAGKRMRKVGEMMAKDYEVAAGRIAAARKRQKRTENIVPADGVGGEIARRKDLVDNIKDLHGCMGVMGNAGEGKVVYDLTEASLQRTWEAAGREGRVESDVRMLVKKWVEHLDALQAAVFKQEKMDRFRGKPSAVKSPVKPSSTIADLTLACNTQLPPLTALLEKLSNQNTTVTAHLHPRLSSSLTHLHRKLASNPLNSLLSTSDTSPRTPSPSPLPLTSVPQPIPMRKERSPDTWLVSAGEFP
eukprot:TRINITY_DN23856_c0_g1_i1.p1 TRINITY_DN23856_c0_g1~~TRINITY_DN23856_c0_g1_i1.p1  ORF type:complete len:477 (+),score=54.95 TRINITY_DN23856_c0_g1_i1:58-1431(+)